MSVVLRLQGEHIIDAILPIQPGDMPFAVASIEFALSILGPLQPIELERTNSEDASRKNIRIRALSRGMPK